MQRIDYVERWRQIVSARRVQHDAACAAQGDSTVDYWARRATRFHKFASEASLESQPFIERILSDTRPDDDVLDVGAGTGRYALPLARHIRHVTALDPSPAMLDFLRADAEAAGLTNVSVFQGSWPEAASLVAPADVVLCAHVLYPIEDIVPFLRALDGQARRAVYLRLMAQQPWFDRLELWEAVHSEARVSQPTYIDVVNVLHQLGCLANVAIDRAEGRLAFDGIEDAAEHFATAVAADGQPALMARLMQAIEARSTPDEGGRVLIASGVTVNATVWWEAGALD
jgi:SAM-dependent methyltransferase